MTRVQPAPRPRAASRTPTRQSRQRTAAAHPAQRHGGIKQKPRTQDGPPENSRPVLPKSGEEAAAPPWSATLETASVKPLEAKGLQALGTPCRLRVRKSQGSKISSSFFRREHRGGRVGFESLAVRRTRHGVLNVLPHLHGVALNDHVSILTADAGIDEREQHL